MIKSKGIVATSVLMNKELGSLNSDITTTEGEIKKLEAKVTGLTQQRSSSELYLANAKRNDETATANNGFVTQVCSGIIDTITKTNRVTVNTLMSGQRIQSTASIMADLIKQLVYSIELIDALAITINKNKQANILIPDDLVNIITTAGSDANNAMALSLIALQSCCVSMTASEQVGNITLVEHTQSLELYGVLSGKTAEVEAYVAMVKEQHQMMRQNDKLEGDLPNALQTGFEFLVEKESDCKTSLMDLLAQAGVVAGGQLTEAKTAKDNIDKDLTKASSELEREKTNLESLQAGLTAATAAAMAA
jgi:hypothetical protein